ncbi:YkgJ family cysteine cluster protein [Gilvimarinus polysaccharolyticus]|uniref:YkgJ family cysteine cluster protein n=1 Tax=Gilvimarinus polysaccharolyticus TaxID=863921 RepID=UPI00067359AE|nr:YkgJ family cysteine cluster protein [Gilvimarinus polysaccharolyticus]
MDNIEYIEIIDFATTNSQSAINSIPKHLELMESNLAGKLAGSKINTMNKLRRLYDAMDKMSAYLDKYSACKSGCSNCCYYPVTISDIEVKYIEKNEHLKRARVIPKSSKDKYKGAACTFLKDGKCSIYSSRPFVCRHMLSMAKTSKVCEPKYAFDYTLPLIRFDGFRSAYDLIKIESGQEINIYDIRDIFYRKY